MFSVGQPETNSIYRAKVFKEFGKIILINKYFVFSYFIIMKIIKTKQNTKYFFFIKVFKYYNKLTQRFLLHLRILTRFFSRIWYLSFNKLGIEVA